MTRYTARRSTWIARILVLSTLALGTGCDGGRRPMQPEAPAEWMAPHARRIGAQAAPLVHFSNPFEARYHMRMHFGDLRMVEHLLIAGKLDEGRSLAYLLTRPATDAGLTRLDERSRRVTEAARELTGAPSVNQALRQLARVAVECAGCHVDAGSTPAFASPRPPADEPTAEARMARHAWAAERLWEAILGADDARWRGGLAALADAPLPPDVLSNAGTLGRDLQTYARAQLDTRGSASLESRGIAYGEILVLCARCHATRY